MAFSFPYPVNGPVTRPVGQGCKSCTHSRYCMALYWFFRYTLREVDDHNGLACTSWSNNPADTNPPTPTQTDVDEENYMYVQGIQSEPNRNGITDATTGSWKRP